MLCLGQFVVNMMCAIVQCLNPCWVRIMVQDVVMARLFYKGKRALYSQAAMYVPFVCLLSLRH